MKELTAAQASKALRHCTGAAMETRFVGLSSSGCPSFRHRPRCGAAHIHVGVQALVWVQFRRIARQIKDLDAIRSFRKPVFHRLRMMGAEIVEDQKDLFRCILYQRLQKLDQSIRVSIAVDNHPSCLPLFATRQIIDICCEPGASVRAALPSKLVPAVEPACCQRRLVASHGSRRPPPWPLPRWPIVLASHFFTDPGALLIRASDRLLRREAPTLQKFAHSAHQQFDLNSTSISWLIAAWSIARTPFSAARAAFPRSAFECEPRDRP